MIPRKPPVSMPADPPPMESLDIRITVRFMPADVERFRLHARQRGEELSRYIRRCSLMGDSVLERVSA